MMYQYYLDGALLTQEPLGWQEMTSKIERVDEVKGLFVTVDLTLTFYGDAFDTLIASYGAGFCNDHTIRIDESCDEGRSYTTIYDGIIYISDCTFDYNNCTVEAKVQDNSFYAKINNNKSIKTLLEVGTSKNNVSITAADDYQIEVYDPCSAPAYIAAPRTPHAVRVFEAFRVLVAFMTDDTVDFQSSFFDVGGEGEGYCITDGIHLSSTNANEYSVTNPIEKICFIDLFNEMNKRFNLGMMIDSSGARPVLIIEQYNYFKNAESVLSMSKINGFKAGVDVDALFSQVHFGGNSEIGNGCPAPALAFPNDTLFMTFKDETFYILGTCNIDKTLDLYCQWISDSNIIQDCVVNGSESYETDIFVIETTYNTANSGTAVQGNPFNDPVAAPRFYNPSLLNSAIAPRYLGAVPNTIAQVLNNINDEFWAHRNSINYYVFHFITTSATVSPVVFQNDFTPPYFDTGGNFTLATGRYTCPAASGGLYRFYSQQRFQFTSYSWDETVSINDTNYFDLVMRIRIVQHDGVNPINSDEREYIYTNYPRVGTRNIYDFLGGITTSIAIYSKAFSLSNTTPDYCYTEVEWEYHGYGSWSGISWGDVIFKFFDGDYKTILTSSGGGELQTYDPDEYPAFKYEFEYPLTKDDFQLLLNQPNYAVTLDVDGTNTFKAFIKEAKYKRKTGMAQFTCIASKSIDE